MTTNEPLIDPELRRVLWACLSYWNAEPIPFDERVVCYSWVVRRYQGRFGGTFHQSRLQQLAQLGLLTKKDTSRGGNRRYYKIDDPAQSDEMVKKWDLN
jgi:hypothetical protein